MNESPLNRIAPFLVLFLCCVFIWYIVLDHARDNYSDIAAQIDAMQEQVLLPYRLAELRTQEPRDTLYLPVVGVDISEVDDTWGAPRSGGRSHEGIDVFSERGRTVLSATEGYVIEVGTSGRGGNVVWVMGPGGVRYYYAHLEAVMPSLTRGVRVGTTTQLGFVGDSGNAATTPPHLHFGMYTEEGPQNPYPLLVERGE